MNRTINVKVKNKIAVADDTLYICGNSDFVINFDFDDEWAEHTTKTARFIFDGQYADVVFVDNRCPVPVMSNIYDFKVGVYVGDLQTTTPARVAATKSILCENGAPAAPHPDVYAQLKTLFELGVDKVYAMIADFDWIPTLWHEQYNGVVYKERAWVWSGKVGIPLYELGAQNSAYLKEGDTVIVYWDGQEYKRTVQYYETKHPDSPWLYIGNLSPIYNDSIGLTDTGEPFCVILQTDNGERTCSFWTVSEEYAGQHTVAIYAVEYANHLPDQFLSDTVVKNGDSAMTLTSSGGKTFRITVNDNGNLTASEVTA